jgi:hypothetical protein
LREKASELAGRRPEPGLLLLADLRHLHRVAAGVSLDWELLAQGAQAAKDSELLALTDGATRSRCARCDGPTPCSRCCPPRS